MYEGSLQWVVSKPSNKVILLQVLLLDNFLLLLEKDNNKYRLKFNQVTFTTGKEDSKVAYNPVLHYPNVIMRKVATGKPNIPRYSVTKQFLKNATKNIKHFFLN